MRWRTRSALLFWIAFASAHRVQAYIRAEACDVPPRCNKCACAPGTTPGPSSSAFTATAVYEAPARRISIRLNETFRRQPARPAVFWSSRQSGNDSWADGGKSKGKRTVGFIGGGAGFGGLIGGLAGSGKADLVGFGGWEPIPPEGLLHKQVVIPAENGSEVDA
jgi:hypothetical protein